MEKDNKSSQEKFYETINKTITDSIKILKYAIYPLAIAFIFITVFWGVDIIKLHGQLENIKSNLDVKIMEIEIKQRETNLIAEEKLRLLKGKLSSIDSSFSLLENQYKKALNASSYELIKLKKNTDNVSDITKSINNEINTTLNEYKVIKKQYLTEIEYATKGTELRKKDIEEMYRKSKVLLLNLVNIIETTIHYINENVKGTLASSYHDDAKVKQLNVKLEKLLSLFKKQLNDK